MTEQETTHRPLSLWTLGVSHPAIVERAAKGAEDSGWDGMLVVDSQNLAGDPFVGLTLAARATSSLMLGTGVTNPATRHPAATAAAIGSIHVASGGRAVLGIGRGDSALAHLGLAPASPDDLEDFVQTVRSYLRREGVDFAKLSGFHRSGARPISSLGLADAPTDSRFTWLPAQLPPVPVEVVATGPRMLAIAAANADRVLLAVGADRERVGWAVEQVRAANPTVPIGAFVTVVTADNRDTARELAAGGIATFARFSVMDGVVRSPASTDEREQLERLHESYDMNKHTQSANDAATLTPDFADRFAILGPPSHCVDRIRDLTESGIDRLIVVGPSTDSDPALASAARQRFVSDVMPAIRADHAPSGSVANPDSESPKDPRHP